MNGLGLYCAAYVYSVFCEGHLYKSKRKQPLTHMFEYKINWQKEEIFELYDRIHANR